MPFEFGSHQIGLLADHRLEARVIVGEAFDLAVGVGILRQDRPHPHCSSRGFVGEAERIKDLGHSLTDRDDLFGCFLERNFCPQLVTVNGYWVAARLVPARPVSPRANVMAARIWRMETSIWRRTSTAASRDGAHGRTLTW